MSGIDRFLEMGGYGGFVWPAYAVAAIVLIGLAAAAVRGYRRRTAELRAIEAADAAEKGHK